MNELISNKEYRFWLNELKNKIRKKQIQAVLSVNKTLMELYWDLGKDIIEKQQDAVWGSNFIEQLSIDLRHEFPEIKEFSRRNLYAIRQWYLFYSEHFEFVPQAAAQIPWGHNRLIIGKIKDIKKANFYSQATTENGWGRDILDTQISNQYFERKGNALNNFTKTLLEHQSDLAKQTIKDPYNFDFLGLEDDAQEREIERELVHRITDFLLELGKGFAFVGRQYKIEINEKDYFIDMMLLRFALLRGN
jgi:predicted nuclease of restriction endonuclease-like (RecB) superfamily